MNFWKQVFLILSICIFLPACSFKPKATYDVPAEQADISVDEAVHVKNSLEWWYFTGHLKNEEGYEYGLEYVFFHFNPFGKNDYMMVNFAVTDPVDSAFYYDYKIVKKKNLLESQLPIDFSVEKKGELWSMKGQHGEYYLNANMTNKKQVGIELHTKSSKSVLMHHGSGYEKYGDYATAGYYSYPRLDTEGTITINNNKQKVSGELWYDRQWNCIGVWQKDIAWDWISIQLEGSKEEIMAYSLHHEKDSMDVVGGSYFSAENENIYLDRDDLTIEEIAFWKSKDSKKRYPIKWKVKIPSLGFNVFVEALIPNQELKLGVAPLKSMYYWEGMCKVYGTKNGKNIKGKSYVEITNR